MTCTCPLTGHPSSVAHRYYRLRPPVQSYDDASHCNPIRLIHYFNVPSSFVPKTQQEHKTIYDSIPSSILKGVWPCSYCVVKVKRWFSLQEHFLNYTLRQIAPFGMFVLDLQCFRPWTSHFSVCTSLSLYRNWSHSRSEIMCKSFTFTAGAVPLKMILVPWSSNM